MFLQSSREVLSSPTHAPGVSQLADIFHFDTRVHKQKHLEKTKCLWIIDDTTYYT